MDREHSRNNRCSKQGPREDRQGCVQEEYKFAQQGGNQVVVSGPPSRAQWPVPGKAQCQMVLSRRGKVQGVLVLMLSFKAECNNIFKREYQKVTSILKKEQPYISERLSINLMENSIYCRS